MEDIALAATAILLVGVATAVWARQFHHAGPVRVRTWACLDCGLPNETDRDTCWSCGQVVGEARQDPSHVPLSRRWECDACGAWNGIARKDCWRCAENRFRNT